jgi:transmembrane sensor
MSGDFYSAMVIALPLRWPVSPNPDVARKQAIAWLARSDRGLSPAERLEFHRWRSQPDNASALQDIDVVWSDLDPVVALRELFPPPRAAVRQRRWGLVLGVTASLAVLALATAALLQWRSLPANATPDAAPVARVDTYTTAVGEQRSISLADGSVLTLNTDSRVEVSLDGGPRSVRLLRGEAHFVVSPDAQRPFQVTAQGRLIQAVGTAFDLRLRKELTLDLTVTDGSVSVQDAPEVIAGSLPHGADLRQQVTAGEALHIRRDGRYLLRQLDPQSLASLLAWRSGRLSFQGETLQEAVQEFSRYTPDRFEIPDRRLRELRISGDFPARDLRALQSRLESGFGLTLIRVPNQAWRVERIQPAGPG